MDYLFMENFEDNEWLGTSSGDEEPSDHWVITHPPMGKNYYMLLLLELDAGYNYTEEEGRTKLEYYLDNLVKADSLKSFIDDLDNGLLQEAFLSLDKYSKRTEAILRYIVSRKNFKFHQDDVVYAACRSEFVFFKLIEAGGNVHHTTLPNEFTALQLAVLGQHKNVVKYLLDQNVNVNWYNRRTYTALHYAFQKDNFEIIELLIQNGADLYLRDVYHLTPLEYAINFKLFDTATLVLNSKLTANIITFDLAKNMFSRFCRLHLDFSDRFVLFLTPKPNPYYKYFKFFKFLYEKLIKYFIENYNITDPPILSIYLNNNMFKIKYWTEALKIILTSEIASKLLEECLSYENESIYTLLIPQLIRAEVEQEDVIELFKLLLSLDMVPNLKDMTLIFSHYGRNKEFQLLKLSVGKYCLVNGYNQENPMEYLAIVFCGLEDDLDYNRIYGKELPGNFYNNIKPYFTLAVSNCSSNAYYRNSEINILPNILSLHELSRNSARKFLKNNKILSPSDFISTVLSLPISIKYKNYILLETKVCEF